jgi:hypothetical protein
MKLAKKTTDLVAVQLDISKAFDTVPHEAIEDTITRKGIPQYVAKLIRGSYIGIRTLLTTGNMEVPIEVKRGVKEGDTQSPFIFNALMEPLILDLERRKGFQINEECSVSSLAFADDIILVAPDDEGAKGLLDATERYLGDLNMKIPAQKCTAFRIHPTKDSWYLADPMLETADGDKIPYANASTYIRYLGGKISPWKGLVPDGLEEDFRTTLQRVELLALKPHQKARLISNYLIPQYIYTLVLALIPVTTVRRLDQELRKVMKNIFHLPQCTANGSIYRRRTDGSLWRVTTQ